MTLIMLFNYYENILIDKQVEYQEKYFSRILNSLPVEIIVMDEKFKYRFINKEAIKDDHMREWLIGKDDYDYVKYRAKNKSIADERFEFYRSVSSNQEYGHLEEVIYTAQGQKKYTDKTLMYIDDEDLGSAMRYIGYSIDSTSKKEAEIMLKQYMLKLEKSNEELKQFAYITSHDLKSPLRNINSLLQLTKKRNENILDQDSKDLIETCIKSANYLYTVVGDVLLYTTSEADKSVYVKIDLNDIISEIIKNNTVFFKEKKAEIILKKEFPQIFSHRTMMFNLFSNLIQNGIKYNKSEVPKVTIDYTESEDYYYFSVSDNGIGIDEKYKDQIFIVFKRLHNQSEYEGTGIGLSICKQIVENLGGSISFISKLGEGSTFYFNLPKSKQLDSH
jgi:signal transduction histidine kinase